MYRRTPLHNEKEQGKRPAGSRELFMFVIALFLVLAMSLSAYALFSKGNVSHYSFHHMSEAKEGAAEEVASESGASSTPPNVLHLRTPEHVKGIYMSSWVAGTPSVRARIEKILDTTEVNAVVIDVKDSSGVITFEIEDKELAAESVIEKRIPDIHELIDTLHKKNVYLIARVAVFQDPGQVKLHPERAVQSKKTGVAWKDRKGLAWIDTGSREHWEYIARVSEYAYSIGFDEIGFDYIRFPTDGDLSDMVFPVSGQAPNKEKIVTEFFAFIGEKMREKGIPSSADIFGLTVMAGDDLGIGQRFEAALHHFDYVSPMTYPSHYANNAFSTFTNPNAHPYETIKQSYIFAFEKIDALARKEATQLQTVGTSTKGVVDEASYTEKKEKYIAKLRPFLQDFSMGVTYGREEVRDQIRALEELGIHSWLLWDPKNKYTVEALSV